MKTRKMLHRLLGAALAGSLLTVAIPAKEARAECLSMIESRTINARYVKLGKQRARASWSHRAWKKYGTKFRWWKNAKDKGYTVKRVGGFYRYTVKAYGRPCN